MAAVVVEQTLEQKLTPRPLRAERHSRARQLNLHLIKEIAIEDRRMLSRMTVTVMIDFAAIDPVLKQVGQRAVAEEYAATGSTGRERSDASADRLRPQLLQQSVERAEREIAAKYHPDDLGLALLQQRVSDRGRHSQRAEHLTSKGLCAWRPRFCPGCARL